jgi:hypothetical protein
MKATKPGPVGAWIVLAVLVAFLILAIAFVTGLTQSQSAPTYQAVITTLVPAREIPKAVALNSLQFNLSRGTALQQRRSSPRTRSFGDFAFVRPPNLTI